MIVKVWTAIVVEVEDDGQAERASARLDSGLDSAIASGFPEGEIVAAEVDRWERVTDDEIAEKGWSE
jgi:hypothetical protein